MNIDNMNKVMIDELVLRDDLTTREKLNILYKEFYDACFQKGYYEEKAKHLERVIEELNKEKAL